MYEQLVDGGIWDLDASEDAKRLRLIEAFRAKKVLLVLDDLWDEKHELCVNCVDENTASKVLVSSRVRQVVVGSVGMSDDDYVVQIQLPSEKSAVDMLLSTAGISLDAAAPPEALQIVQFCKMLPLAIAIAGKLVKDLELNTTDDWDGIVQILQVI